MEWTNVRSLRLTGFIRLRFVFPNADPCRSLPILADDDENDDEHLTCMTFGWNGHCEDSFRERRCVQRPGFQQKCKETSSSDTRWVLCHCSAHFWLKKAKTDQKQHRAVLTCVLQIYLSNCLFRRPSTEPGHALMDKASVLNPFFFCGEVLGSTALVELIF